MKKTIVSLFAAVSAFSIFTVNTFARNTEFDTWNVTFDGSKIVDSFTDDDSIQDPLAGMQPGDTVTISIQVNNQHKTKVEWYLQNKVLDTFENSVEESGGAYTYKLTYHDSKGNETTLYDSEIVGGDEGKYTTNENLGLKEATDALDDYIFLEEMEANKSGTVRLHVELDGETQGNIYQEKSAKLNMLFAVEVPPTRTPEPKEEVIVNRRDRIIYLPNTGDDSNILLYIAGFFLSLYIMIYAGWRLKRASKGN